MSSADLITDHDRRMDAIRQLPAESRGPYALNYADKLATALAAAEDELGAVRVAVATHLARCPLADGEFT